MKETKSILAAFGAGALFAIGLLVSGMTDPAKVTGFLNLGGAWDPSLALVMVGAIGAHVALRRIVSRRAAPLFDARFHEPTPRGIDARLVAGSAMFGVGWGLAGYCPGPSLVSLGKAAVPTIAFVAAMAAGVLIERALRRARPRRDAPASTAFADG